MSNTIVIYTAITTGYDNLKVPSFVSEGVDYIAFSDVDVKSDFWRVIVIDNDEGLDSVRMARKVKILGHSILREYDFSIWIDGNVDVLGDIKELSGLLDDYALVTFKHPARSCIYEEAIACIEHKKEEVEVIERHLGRLKLADYPEMNGLVESNVIFRRYSAEVDALMLSWFSEVMLSTKRDQLSFNYVCWLHNFKYGVMGCENARGNSAYFVVRGDHNPRALWKRILKKTFVAIKERYFA